MKKMLAKAIALSVIMGGMSFVANDAQAYVKVDTDRGGYVHTSRPGPGQRYDYELVEKKDINGIESKAEAAQKTANAAAQNASEAKKVADAANAKADANKQAIETNKQDTTNKFAKVQEQLDAQDNKNKAQDVTIKAHTEAIKANKTAIETNKQGILDLNNRVNFNSGKIYENKVAIENEATARKNADAELDNKITAEETARKAADEQLQKNIDAEEQARKDADAAEKAEREAADKVLDGKITTEKNERIAADERIEAKFDGEVARLDSRIDKLDKKIEKVGAMAAAIANLHTMGYDPAAPTEIAVGVGQYRDKTGVALGAFHYPNRDFMLSFSVSTAGDEYMGGIGATWKFGRKTPEEMRQAEHEKAVKAKVAKAEAAKKAAKDARVAAQQQRHAEMLAARTAK